MTKTRQTKTIAYIQEALTLLLQKEHFENISVTDICRTAGINRGTFYLHFLDKYDMMDQLKNQDLGHFHDILADSETIFSIASIQEALDYVQANRAFFQALAHSTYADLPKTIRDLLASLLGNVPGFDQAVSQRFGLPASHAKTAYFGALEALITRWITDDIPESPASMAKLLSQFADVNR